MLLFPNLGQANQAVLKPHALQCLKVCHFESLRRSSRQVPATGEDPPSSLVSYLKISEHAKIHQKNLKLHLKNRLRIKHLKKKVWLFQGLKILNPGKRLDLGWLEARPRIPACQAFGILRLHDGISTQYHWMLQEKSTGSWMLMGCPIIGYWDV